ncbi:DoxX family protein [Amycolatopsis sp. lyj-346]|uniref:DoxX family protein n=1 Tax=Amycolatopsis sp. lyj-346 TaxID=2789289 RepID=UPI00397BF343
MHRLDPAREHFIGLYRIVIGFLFACHGLKTLFGLFGAKSTAAVGAWPGWWAAVIQLVCGVLVCVGLGARVAAVLGSGSMAYAYFVVHLPTGLFPIQNGGELSALFCWSLLLIAFVGAGRFALGNLAVRQRSSEPTRAGAAI